ncbi:MAG: NADP-dependent glyceraldehyde-3-phosphate dehydrogenase [Candidatus Wallbacteria bacterium HGW-Wallbacteria-1]|uniref:NADP-dependent glyceraldehyde-3-phosphate dehydrogenase n=1 Tax=Candidatus Wallbacteria bacterium HGW-Wallbacteria-1 TaxID=2013854 RepID=A0A2N1PVL6_9BACT|nr:MAG: NADP-dependent glyceraldehyde-3-phosphate dehydrogenase [Candidatus Wallbacteria bacterium HGW-Wallbacteria-1]
MGEPLHQREYLIDGEIHIWDGPVEKVLSPLPSVLGRGGICTGEQFGEKSLEQSVSSDKDLSDCFSDSHEESCADLVIGSYPLMTGDSALKALDSSVRAWDSGRGVWPLMSVEERISCLRNFVSAMRETRPDVVRLLMWEIGKSLTDSMKEFDRTIDYILDTIEAMKDLDRASSRFEIRDGIMAQIRRAPLGVVLCMGPFNYPLNETFTTLIPALLMGNIVIFKPPKLGVLLHRPLLEAFRESFPPGVVNTVYGDGGEVVGPLMKSGRIDCLAFIGSSRVADILKNQHPKPHRMRAILGLEAKNAAIVLPDADMDLVVREILMGSLSFNGQRCTALKMIFVHQSVAEEFLEKFIPLVNSLIRGFPWTEKVAITPLPEPDKIENLQALVEDAVIGGAQIVNRGGGRVQGKLFHPAVMFPVAPGMRLWSEEQFGPIVPVSSFEDVEEPLSWVRNSDYGQQVSIFGRDSRNMSQLMDQLVNQVCRVNVNCQCQRGPDSFPFTGRRDSAEGTLSVTDALRVFSIRTLVAAKMDDSNRRLFTRITRDHESTFLSTDFIL